MKAGIKVSGEAVLSPEPNLRYTVLKRPGASMPKITDLYRGIAKEKPGAKQERPDVGPLRDRLRRGRARPRRKSPNKRKLAARMVSTGAFSSRAEAMRFLDAFVEAASEALARGERVTVKGFGTLRPAELKARSARNPRTGRSMRVPPGKTVRFRPGFRLRRAVAWLNPIRPSRNRR